MIGHDSHTHLLGNKEHQTVIGSELIDEELGVSCKSREMQGNCLLIKRSGNHRVQISVLEILDSLTQGYKRGIGSLRSRLAWINAEIVRYAIYNVHPLWMIVLGGADDIGIKTLHIRKLFLVKAECPRRAVHHGNTEIQQTGICQ